VRRLILLGTLVAAGVAAPAAAEVRIAMQGGVVSLQATNATLREILAEWARVGRTTVLNGDKVQGGPITLQLLNVPEAQALEVLLRTISGYVAAPRRVANPGLSVFDRILIMPASAAPRAARPAAAPPMFQPPRFPQPQAQPQEDDQSQDQGFNQPPQRAPVFTPFAQSQGVAAQPPQPQETPAPQASPRSQPPVGVAVPGMVTAPTLPVPASGGRPPGSE
jgi:hypothetical protein